MKSPMGGGQHGMIPGSPGCRSNVSQTSPGSGTLEVAPRSRWDVSSFQNNINSNNNKLSFVVKSRFKSKY